jgi:hypothetical protein
MRPVPALLFALTRQDFTSADAERASAIARRLGSESEWDALARIAAADGVAPIVGVNLASCGDTGVPARVAQRFELALFENVAFKIERRRQLAEAIAHLDRTGHDAIILKSAALELSGVYEQPWVTASRDLDLIVRARTPGATREDFRRALGPLWDRGIECDIATHHDLTLSGSVSLPFDDIWARTHPVSIEADSRLTAYLMSPEDQLLSLCLNGCRKKYLRLKTLFDIAETATRSPIDMDRLRRYARDARIEGVLLAGLAAAAETVGLRKEYPLDTLVSRPRAWMLRSIARMARGCAPIGADASSATARQRLGPTLLKYASLTTGQRWRNVKLTIAPPRRFTKPASEIALATLPGETI